MPTILTFGASTSRHSINARFAAFAGNQLAGHTKKSLDLNEFSMPIYSVDKEEANGIPVEAEQFVKAVADADALIISLAEHNGSYTAAFKNIFDWATRKEQKVWANKPMFLLSTSPGGRGGASVMASAKASFPHLGGNIIASFSLPSFNENFDEATGITEKKLSEQFQTELAKFRDAIN